MDENFAPDLLIQGAGNRGDMVAENIDLRKIEGFFSKPQHLEGFLAAICWVSSLKSVHPEICSYMNFKENAQIAGPFISAGHQDFFVVRLKTIENLANNEPGTKEPAPFFSFYRYACF